MTIVEFLNARLDEREALARDAALMSGWDGFGESRIASGSEWVASYHIVKRKRATEEPVESRKGRELADCGNLSLERAKYIARHDPAWVLADIAAKRAIVDEHAPSGDECRTCCGDPYCEEYWDGETETVVWTRTALPFPCPTVCLLASVYSEHPDYQQDWKP